MKGQRIIGVAALAVTILLSTVVFGAYHVLGFRLNFTQSAPTGLWRVTSVDSIYRGDYVEVCSPSSLIVQNMLEHGYFISGNCANGTIPLLKPIAAIAGDVVTIGDNQPVKVNGIILPNTAAIMSMLAWPSGSYTVKSGDVWLFSTYNESSLDSRYFGPVPTENIRGRAKPWFIRSKL